MILWTDVLYGHPEQGDVVLRVRRSHLRQYELESYAAIGRRVCEALEQGTRSYVDLGHDVVARFVRVIEVTTPAYPELSE